MPLTFLSGRHLVAWTIAFLALCVAGSVADEATESSPATELSPDVVLRINDRDIPSEWFLHEFRSTFFRHAQADNVRQAVFEPFMKRMLLAAKAVELGIDKKPDVAREIDQRIAAMRAFMEYQVEMARIDIMNKALLKEWNIGVSPDELNADELEEYFNTHIKQRPGAPTTFSMVPKHVMETLRAQAAQAKLEQELSALVATWLNDMIIYVNSNVIESVPLPEMKGAPPPGIGRP